MPDQDWTQPKPIGDTYVNPYDKDYDRITVTRHFVMWLLHEVARMSAMVQTVELENARLKAEGERSRDQYNGIIDTQLKVIEELKAEVERLTNLKPKADRLKGGQP